MRLRVCFVHQNMPAQYRHLIEALLGRGDQVLCIGGAPAIRRWGFRHPNLGLFAYDLGDAPPAAAALAGIDLQVRRGRMAAQALRAMLDKGLRPDVIAVHPGWGEAMFLRVECPDVPLLAYCEYFYGVRGSDVDFDPEFGSGHEGLMRTQLRRAPQLLALEDMDAGVSPTAWQRSRFPAVYRKRIEVTHDGVDTARCQPDPGAELELGGRRWRHGDPLVTYVARNLEPYRGFHVFMRSLPALQRRVPQAHVVVVGGDDVSYGLRLPGGQTYRERLVAELGDRVDWSRVTFAGRLPYDAYLRLLQVSAVHVYLTYPFVLSWSLLEAMACGCAVVASATGPVTEVVEDGVNGLLVDFFDAELLALRVAEVLAGRVDGAALRARARATVAERYDLRRVCLPAALGLLERVAAAGRQGEGRGG